MDENTQTLIELNGKLERMVDGIEFVKEKQTEMANDISHIREAVYDPDQGIYARIRELETWKNTSTRLIWLLITSILGLCTATVWANIISN